MKRNVKNLDGAKAQALDFLADSQSFLLISAANPTTKTAPQMVSAVPSEEVMTASLAFLLANIPAFRRTMTVALKSAEVMIGIMN